MNVSIRHITLFGEIVHEIWGKEIIWQTVNKNGWQTIILQSEKKVNK